MTGSTSDNCVMLDTWYTTGLFEVSVEAPSNVDIELRYTCDEVNSTNWFERWEKIPYLDCGCDISSR